MIGPRVNRYIDIQIYYVIIWFVDAKDLHEYVLENIIEIMWICSLCKDIKIRNYEDVRVLVTRNR